MNDEKNLIHNKNIIYAICLSENECISDFMIVPGKYADIHDELTYSEKIRFLFYDKLFNEILENQVESFLSFHYDTSRYNKEDFLRILKWDIDEIFGRFINPGRIIPANEGISIDELPQPKIKEIMPFFKPYDYGTYLTYVRRYKEAKHWIKSKKRELMEPLKAEKRMMMELDKMGKESEKWWSDGEPPSHNTEAWGERHLLSIQTNAKPEQILNFWLKLMSNNEKGEPYWKSEKEIEHFVNQNFEGFEGVNEIKEFAPNMNYTEFYQVTWTFFNTYGINKTKPQYVELLQKNFTKFKNTKNVYNNIADKSNKHLGKLFK